MKVVIIEDETPAAQHLENLLKRLEPNAEIVAHVKSVREAIQWFKQEEPVEVIFMDIQLTDGLSFDIFKEVKPKQPIIFTTAFNQYALQAFQTNGISYLLKPITLQSLREGLAKLKQLSEALQPPRYDAMRLLAESLQKMEYPNAQPAYKERFMVKLGEHIRSIPAREVSYFFADGRTVFLVSEVHGKFVIDYKLEELQEMLNPLHFFRVNRSFIVSIRAIEDVVVYSQSRLKLSTVPAAPKKVIVSRDKVHNFKKWFDGTLY